MAVDTTGPGYLAGEYPGGTTTVQGVPTAAEIRVFYELPSGDWQFVGSATSTSSGTWQMLNVNPDYTFHVLGRLSGYCDVVVSNVQPTRTDTISASGTFTPNAAFNGIAGFVEVVGGLPPYTATVTTPLPFGLTPLMEGRKLIIDGTSEDDGNWISVVQVSASNGPSVSIPVNALIGLNEPTNLKTAYAVSSDWAISLTWTDACSFEEGFRIYRSTSPMDVNSLPAPLDTLPPNTTSYVDSATTAGVTYYYRVSAYCDSGNSVSTEVSRTAKWTPADMSVAPKIWMDWNSDVIDVSGTASSWANRGSTGGAFTQTVAASRPQIVSSGLNGLRIMRFDGSNDYMRHSSAASLLQAVQYGAAMIIYQKRGTDTAATTRQLFYCSGRSTPNRFSCHAGAGVANAPALYTRRVDANTTVALVGTAAVGVWAITFYEMKWSTGAAKIYRNGALNASNDALTTAGSTSNTASTDVLLGSMNTTDNGDADIAALIVFNTAVSTIERQRLEGWAAHTCGLTSSLPSDHPYKTVAP